MSEMQSLIAETATRLFAERCTEEVLTLAEKGHWSAELWDALVQTELHLVSIPEAIGGVGGDLRDAMSVLRISGQYAAPLPLAELSLAGWILGMANIQLPSPRITVADPQMANRVQFDGQRVTGAVAQVPFARWCDYVLLFDGQQWGLVALSEAMIDVQNNVAQEPRDSLYFDNADLLTLFPTPVSTQMFQQRGALLRMAQMVGALDAILVKSIRYVGEREQFGRPIAKFQAIQQYLAQLAGEVSAAQAALEAAIGATERHTDYTAAIAMAKIRIGEAATTTSRIAHQVHGAMGFTYEYPLHFLTKRLWAWRDEYGSETAWAAWLGQYVAEMGADRLWAFVVDS